MDKNKLIESAAKLVAKGAYDKAIKEYSAVLKEDPKDVRVLQKMGELYQKKNDPTQAAQYFAKVAESYATDGFFLKAVALYKQVLKLDPSQLDVNLKLAELHQQLGLMTEAFGYLQGVAAHHEQKGDARASLDVLKRMMELDPENVRSREKLADMMARQDLKREAITEYQRAAEQHRRANRTDDFLRVSERLCQLEPDNLTLNRDLAIAYLDRGDQKRALARLQICFKASPRDPETLQLLAKAFHGLGQKAKTISVYKELAKVYADQGDTQRAESVWGQIRALDPEDAELLARSRPAAPAPAPAAPARPQAQAQAAPTAVSAPVPAAAQPLGREQLTKLLQETDVYVKYGLHDKALEHLRKVFSVEPENLDAHEKAYQIYVAAEHAPQAAEQLLNVLRLCTRQQEIRRAQPYLHTLLRTNPNHVEVPAFMAVLGNAPESYDDVEEVVDDDDLLVVSADDDDEVVVGDPPEDALAGSYGEDEEEAFVASTDDEPFGDEPLVAGMASAGIDDDEATSNGMRFEDPIDEGEVLVTGEYEVEEQEITRSTYRSPERAGTSRGALVPDYGGASFGAQDEDDDTAVSGQPIDDPALEYAVTAGDEDDLVDEEEEAWANDEEPLGADTLDALDDAPDPAAPAGPGFRDEDDLALQAAGDVEDEGSPYAEDEALALAATYEPTTGEELVAEDVAWETPAEGQEVEGGAPEESTVFEAADGQIVPAFSGYGVSALDEPVDAAPAVPVDTWDGASAGGDAAPEDADPRGEEELEEAGFFLDQGLLEEARDILETLSIAYPGHRTVESMLARLEALESGGGEPAAFSDEPAAEEVAPPSVHPMHDGAQDEADAFNLAQELADDFDAAADSLPTAGGDDFQYSVEEVFSEFKKGLAKVVRPEDVDTHYDLGIAYKEMGLLDDAISEFKVAREGCLGKRKELDCLTMVGMLQLMRGDSQAAVDAYREALGSEHAGGDTQVALLFELGTCFDAMGQQGKALHYFQRVAQLDGAFREVSTHVQRLEAVATPEPDAPLPGGVPMPGTTGARSRKVGYL